MTNVLSTLNFSREKKTNWNINHHQNHLEISHKNTLYKKLILIMGLKFFYLMYFGPYRTSSFSFNHQKQNEILDLEKEFALERIESSPIELRNASYYNDDKEIVLMAVTNQGMTLEFASKRLKNDKDVVYTALKNNSSSINYVGTILKHDKDLYKTFPHTFPFAPQEIQDDKETVLIIVKLYGSLIRYASKRLQSDKEVLLEAVKHFGSGIMYASDDLKTDKELVGTALNVDGLSLQYIPNFQDDKEMVSIAVQQNGNFEICK